MAHFTAVERVVLPVEPAPENVAVPVRADIACPKPSVHTVSGVKGGERHVFFACTRLGTARTDSHIHRVDLETTTPKARCRRRASKSSGQSRLFLTPGVSSRAFVSRAAARHRDADHLAVVGVQVFGVVQDVVLRTTVANRPVQVILRLTKDQGEVRSNGMLITHAFCVLCSATKTTAFPARCFRRSLTRTRRPHKLLQHRLPLLSTPPLMMYSTALSSCFKGWRGQVVA